MSTDKYFGGYCQKSGWKKNPNIKKRWLWVIIKKKLSECFFKSDIRLKKKEDDNRYYIFLLSFFSLSIMVFPFERKRESIFENKSRRKLDSFSKTFLTHFFYLFLVACTRLYTPLCRSVGLSIGWSPFTFSAFLSFLSIQLLPGCPSDLLQHCSCPPARD